MDYKLSFSESYLKLRKEYVEEMLKNFTDKELSLFETEQALEVLFNQGYQTALAYMVQYAPVILTMLNSGKPEHKAVHAVVCSVFEHIDSDGTAMKAMGL